MPAALLKAPPRPVRPSSRPRRGTDPAVPSQCTCGSVEPDRRLRFALIAARDGDCLRYAFGRLSSSAPAAAQRAAVRSAFAAWAPHVPFRIVEAGPGEPCDVRVRWIPADDPDALPAGTLARHWPVVGAEEIRFNDAIPWATDGRLGAFDVATTAVHEAGHAVGLWHSDVAGSVMTASINRGALLRDLGADDLAAMRRLYPRIERFGDSGRAAGETTAHCAVRTGASSFAAVLRDGSRRLALIGWRTTPEGGIVRTGDLTHDGPRAAAATVVPGTDVLDAARDGRRIFVSYVDGDRKLRLVAFRADAAGKFAAEGPGAAAGVVSIVRVVALGGDDVLTACRNAAGKLLLISWRRAADGTFLRLADSGAAAGAVSEIAAVGFGPGPRGRRVVTAVRDGRGKLLVIGWTVDAEGRIARRGDSGAAYGDASRIRATRDGLGRLLVALKDGGGCLFLTTQTIEPGGGLGDRRLRSWGRRKIDEVDVMARPGGGCLAAARSEDGPLRLFSFAGQAGEFLVRTRSFEQTAGDASLVRLVPEPLSGAGPVVTAVRARDGRLLNIAWNDDAPRPRPRPPGGIPTAPVSPTRRARPRRA
jgi:hypothetical protein